MYCTNCGNIIGDDQKFCSKCGTKTGNNVNRNYMEGQAETNNANVTGESYKMACPRCGNKNLQMVNQSNIHTQGKDYSAGKGCLGWLVLGPIGLLCGMCGKGRQISSTNTISWVCPECGMIVNSQSSGGEIKKKNPILIVLFFFLILVGLFFLLSLFVSVSVFESRSLYACVDLSVHFASFLGLTSV